MTVIEHWRVMFTATVGSPTPELVGVSAQGQVASGPFDPTGHRDRLVVTVAGQRRLLLTAKVSGPTPEPVAAAVPATNPQAVQSIRQATGNAWS